MVTVTEIPYFADAGRWLCIEKKKVLQVYRDTCVGFNTGQHVLWNSYVMA